MQIRIWCGNLIPDVSIDPICASAKTGSEGTAHSVAEHTIDWTRPRGITVVWHGPHLDESGPRVEGTPLPSSDRRYLDHLNYLVSRERNRGLSIIKSRGTPLRSRFRGAWC